MFVGGCAGSTSGGTKVIRSVLMIKYAFLELGKLIHPKGIMYLKGDRRTVPINVIHSIHGFFVFNILFLTFASLALAALGLDFESAGSSVLACLLNVGPALGSVGPTHTYADVPALGKLILAICMLIGRLEMYTVLVLFLPSFWRK